MTVQELQEALSPLLDELQSQVAELQLTNQILAGCILFMGVIFGALLIRALLEHFK